MARGKTSLAPLRQKVIGDSSLAGVVELVDTADSKSAETCALEGSSPSSGTALAVSDSLDGVGHGDCV